jgi:hypothetical protein
MKASCLEATKPDPMTANTRCTLQPRRGAAPFHATSGASSMSGRLRAEQPPPVSTGALRSSCAPVSPAPLTGCPGCFALRLALVLASRRGGAKRLEAPESAAGQRSHKIETTARMVLGEPRARRSGSTSVIWRCCVAARQGTIWRQAWHGTPALPVATAAAFAMLVPEAWLPMPRGTCQRV